MDAILALARSEGFITTRQALRLGGSYSVLNRLVAQGRLLHPTRSVYLPVDAREGPGSVPGTAEMRHALLAKGLLSERHDWVASHHSALTLWGVPLWDVPFGELHMAGRQRNSVRRGSVHLHVLRPGDPVEEVDGYQAVAPSFAALEVAARFGAPAGLVATDACLRLGLTTPEHLGVLVQSGRWQRGIGAIRRVVGLADARAGSPMESLLRLHLIDGDWTTEPQANLGGPGAGYCVDLLIDGRVVVEYDGEDKYRGPGGHRAVLDEKAREDYLRAQGYGFVRVVKNQMAYPVALRIVVGKALAEHRRQNAVPPRQRRKEQR